MTDEDREKRRQDLLEYHRLYYQAHKEDIKKKSYINYATNLETIREFKQQNNPDFKPRNRKREIINQYIAK